MDGHDPKEFPVLHERNAEAAARDHKEAQQMKGCITVLVLLGLLIHWIAFIPTLMP